VIFSEVVSDVCCKITEETICEWLNEIGFNIFGLFDIESSAMELVAERQGILCFN